MIQNKRFDSFIFHNDIYNTILSLLMFAAYFPFLVMKLMKHRSIWPQRPPSRLTLISTALVAPRLAHPSLPRAAAVPVGLMDAGKAADPVNLGGSLGLHVNLRESPGSPVDLRKSPGPLVDL